MSYLYARIRKRTSKDKNRKILQTDEQIYAYSKTMVLEKTPYCQESLLDEGSWYYIEDFSKSKHVIGLINEEFSSVDFDNISKDEIGQIEYLFSISEDGSEMYFQKIGKAALVSKKRISWLSGQFEYSAESPSIVINEHPDAVYNKLEDVLYFKTIPSITGIFPDIADLYREATKEETEAFFKMDFLTIDGLTVEQVNQPNLKRIALIKEVLDSMTKKDQNSIIKYISDYCDDLSDGKGSFVVKNNEDLKLVLYGVDQRFYTTPVGREQRIANSIIKMKK